MDKSSSFDFCIIGAGLAGLAAAGELHSSGAKIAVVDKGDIASGASGTPIGLVNPATGRFGTKSWKAEKCYKSIFEDLENIQSQTTIPFFRKSGILRPAVDAKIANKMQGNLSNTNWPKNWCNWLDENEIRQMNDEITCVEGGLWIPVGLTVDIPCYLRSKAEILEKNGVKFKKHSAITIKNHKNQFEITGASDGKTVWANSVIYCSGSGTKSSSYWDFLPLMPVKGQVAVFKKSESLKLKFAVSALGYIGSLSPNTFTIGSTYEHNFEHVAPDEKGLHYMQSRLKKVYPSLFEDSEIIGQWAGLRASTPNRMPILGRHPDIDNLYVFAGLGSKGMLYSCYLSNKLSDFILNSTIIPKEVSIERFTD